MPTHTVVACPEHVVIVSIIKPIPAQNFVMEHRPTELGVLSAIMLLVVPIAGDRILFIQT